MTIFVAFPHSHPVQIGKAIDVRMRRLFTVAFIATTIISCGGWLWLLGISIRWLIAKF